MGEIKDALDTMHDLKADFAEAGIYSTKRSISASAMEGTANFPVLVEDSISLDDGILIARALERKYASFLLTVLTMDPYLEVEKGQTPSASEYLKQFHQNMRVKSSTKGIHMDLHQYLKESYEINDMDYGIMESEAFKMAHAIYEGVKQSVPQDKNILLNYAIEEVTTPDSLNSRFSVPITEAKKTNGGNNNHDNFVKSSDDWFDAFYGDKSSNTGKSKSSGKDKGKTTNNGNSGNNNTGKGDSSRSTGGDDATVRIKIDNGSTNISNGKSDITRDKTLPTKPLLDAECKKANDMVPTLLHIRVYPIDKYTREELSPVDFIMGVKATLHPIPMNEIARMVVSGMRNENMIFNFIRWTTGEIKFFKDFLFAIDTIKMDAKDSGNDVTGWRPALKRRKARSKAKLRLTNKSIMPNATLIVSQGAVEFIKENYGYDLSSEMIINRLMDVYFLLGFVSVNTVNQRATFRFDGIESSDTYTFDTLKRENQSDDKAFKNMMKMLGRSM